MGATRVVHVNDNVPGAVYIGRAVPRRGLKASRWANAFTVDQHGRVGAIELYEYYLREALDGRASQSERAALRELIGKPLACWCRRDGEERTEDNACHGDILVHLIQELGLEPEEDPFADVREGLDDLLGFVAGRIREESEGQ